MAIAIDHGGEFCFRPAVLRADSEPFAIMNTLKFLAIVKIKFLAIVKIKFLAIVKIKFDEMVHTRG